MSRFILAAALLSAAMACPQHDLPGEPSLMKRASIGDWTYSAISSWSLVNDAYALCGNGTQQSPIPLSTANGFSKTSKPTFNYPNSTPGVLHNWGYGVSFTLTSNAADLTGNPSMTFDGETVYLKGWHVHTPAEHTVDNKRSKAELHLVHATAQGKERAVVGLMIDTVTGASAANSTFLESLQLFKFPSTQDTTTKIATKLDMKQALKEVKNVNTYFTYSGSLTSPPCTEGLKWFVAGSKLLVKPEQMKELLNISAFSARDLQPIINQLISL